MQYSLKNLAALSLPALANAATHMVKVADGGLTFTPSTVSAAKGDTVVFTWSNPEHSVSQGDLSKPCQPASNGFNSGTVETTTMQWTVTVTSTDPIYYYCAVNSHCQRGMVGGINVPSIDDYKKAASSASSNVMPMSVQGGVFAAVGSSSGGGSGGSPSPAPSSSSMMMSSGTSASMSMSMTMSSTMAAPSSSGGAAMAPSSSMSMSTMMGGTSMGAMPSMSGSAPSASSSAPAPAPASNDASAHGAAVILAAVPAMILAAL